MFQEESGMKPGVSDAATVMSEADARAFMLPTFQRPVGTENGGRSSARPVRRYTGENSLVIDGGVHARATDEINR